MDRFTALASALSDSNRVRALMALERGEACVCRLIELLGLAPSTVSKHMAVLRQAGLVKSRKQGRWIYFRLADGKPDTVAARFISLAQNALKDDETVRSDKKRLKEILQQKPEALCRKQRGSG
jgi:ArsR family transcriptional regulator, arsenate/arsenite/antimonite-responsive transcriptional repressor